MEITVTTKDNVKYDEEGQLIINEAGDIEIIDENVIGIMVKTHLVQVHQVNQETNMVETGVIPKVEVLWEHKRNPAPALENPADLVWLSFGDDEDESESEVTEDYEEDIGEQPLGADVHQLL